MINAVIFMVWSLFYFISIAVKKSPSKFNSISIANSILTGVVVIFWFQNVFYTQAFGACNFSKLRFDGKYRVGVRYFHSNTKDTEVICFYPIDQEEYHKKIKTKNALWMYRPEKIL